MGSLPYEPPKIFVWSSPHVVRQHGVWHGIESWGTSCLTIRFTPWCKVSIKHRSSIDLSVAIFRFLLLLSVLSFYILFDFLETKTFPRACCWKLCLVDLLILVGYEYRTECNRAVWSIWADQLATDLGRACCSKVLRQGAAHPILIKNFVR